MKILLSTCLIIAGVAVSMVGDIFLKKSGASDARMMILGFVFYGLGAFPIAITFKYLDFGVVFLVWQALTIIAALVIGRILFGEVVTINKILALLFVATAMVLAYK